MSCAMNRPSRADCLWMSCANFFRGRDLRDCPLRTFCLPSHDTSVDQASRRRHCNYENDCVIRGWSSCRLYVNSTARQTPQTPSLSSERVFARAWNDHKMERLESSRSFLSCTARSSHRGLKLGRIKFRRKGACSANTNGSFRERMGDCHAASHDAEARYVRPFCIYFTRSKNQQHRIPS